MNSNVSVWSLNSLGGETIKGISQQSGARIELQRNPPPNSDPSIKMFTVRGSPQQIDYARQLVEEKIGVQKFSFQMVPMRKFQLFDSFTNLFFSGTSYSNGWSTWPPWTAWRSRPSWTSWSTRGTNGPLQPRAIQPGTSRASVSSDVLCFLLYLT